MPVPKYNYVCTNVYGTKVERLRTKEKKKVKSNRILGDDG